MKQTVSLLLEAQTRFHSIEHELDPDTDIETLEFIEKLDDYIVYLKAIGAI